MPAPQEPEIDLSARESGVTRPLAVRIDRDGTGSASFDWEPVLDALTRGLEQLVCSALGHDVSVVGVRFLDADGRAADGPAPAGTTLIGFTTTTQ
jgi:hypothetical protein